MIQLAVASRRKPNIILPYWRETFSSFLISASSCSLTCHLLLSRIGRVREWAVFTNALREERMSIGPIATPEWLIRVFAVLRRHFCFVLPRKVGHIVVRMHDIADSKSDKSYRNVYPVEANPPILPTLANSNFMALWDIKETIDRCSGDHLPGHSILASRCYSKVNEGCCNGLWND